MKNLEAIYLKSGVKSTLIEHVIKLINSGDFKSALIDLDVDFDKVSDKTIRSYYVDKIFPSSNPRSSKYPRYLKYIRRIKYKSRIK